MPNHRTDRSRRRRPLGPIAAGVMSVIALVSTGASAVEWPHWQGPDRDGAVEGAQIAPEAAGEPRVLWRKTIGVGFASMAAVDGRVYAMGHLDGKEHVYCLDAKTGAAVWTHSYDGPLINKLHEGGPSSTPTVADGRVYTVGKAGQTRCLDAQTGEVVWAVDLAQRLKMDVPHWGFASSVIVEDGRAYVQAGPIVALDATTGKTVWTSQARKPAYSSPMPFDFGGKRMLATLNTEGVSVVRAQDGREVAFYPWETRFDTNAATPLVLDGGKRLFISSGYDTGCVMLAFNGTKLEPIYRNKSMSNHMANSVPHGDHFYGFDGNSHQSRRVELVCMDIATGKRIWGERGMGCGSLIIADGTMVILSDEGELITAPATPAGFKPIARSRILQGKCWSQPIISGGILFARDNAPGELVAVDMTKQQR